MTIASINGIDLYYEEHGDAAAPPLLLIMGFTMNAAAWASQIPALSERYRVIAFDNRGAGRTTQPEGAYSITQMADDAAGLLDHLGIASAHIVGASMGGMIAQEFALRYPARVRGLVLACTTAGGPHSAGYDEMMAQSEEGMAVTDLVAAMTPDRIKENMDLMFTADFQAHPGPGLMQIAAAALQYPQTLAGMKGQLEAIRAHDTYDRLPQIAAPTLVIAGDADMLVDARNSPLLAQRIPGAKLVMFPGLKHGFTAEKPDEVNAAILGFLTQVDAHATPPARRPLLARIFGRGAA
ncbi:MAG TPA: alpha/beta fold hydrolase [Dehalococcoidia bacterium]|nr:alpha/beta fold hydrolase [Dehalococcoidia bacterium]